MMSDLHFRDRLDSELENIEFAAQNRQKVLDYTIKNAGGTSRQELHRLQMHPVWLERLWAFLDTELRIPVKPLVVALLITLSGFIYGCIGEATVSAEEMQKSSITVLDGNHGGQANDLYKD